MTQFNSGKVIVCSRSALWVARQALVERHWWRPGRAPGLNPKKNLILFLSYWHIWITHPDMAIHTCIQYILSPPSPLLFPHTDSLSLPASS